MHHNAQMPPPPDPTTPLHDPLTPAPARLVYYSIANSPDSSCERQWTQSIRSLRRHNPVIPVWLFLFNGATPELLEEAHCQHVRVEYRGDYREYLHRLHVRGSLLALYPTLHKFLVLAETPIDATSALYLDCDTYFFGDVNRLFDAYNTADWYAREEHASRRSPFGYDPAHIDEDTLAAVAQSIPTRPIAPFNSGVCLLNHQAWKAFSRIRVTFLDLTWRLLCGRELARSEADAADAEVRAGTLQALDDMDRSRALPYPSANSWIIEQIALWLALGQLPDLSQGDLSKDHLAQGSEFRDALAPRPYRRPPVLSHYFSGLEHEFFAQFQPLAR
jgi:hypothetical protein